MAGKWVWENDVRYVHACMDVYDYMVYKEFKRYTELAGNHGMNCDLLSAPSGSRRIFLDGVRANVDFLHLRRRHMERVARQNWDRTYGWLPWLFTLPFEPNHSVIWIFSPPTRQQHLECFSPNESTNQISHIAFPDRARKQATPPQKSENTDDATETMTFEMYCKIFNYRKITLVKQKV